MANLYSLQQFWHDPEIWRRDRWWTVAWLVWGTTCAAGVWFGDQSLPGGIAWLLASSLIAAFGRAVWGLFSMGVFELTPKLWRAHHSADNLPDVGSESASWLFWLENEQLSLLDPNRKWWDLYPAIVLSVAPIHGIWAGSAFGLAAFFAGEWPKSAAQAVLVGSLGGVAAVMMIDGLVAAAFIACSRGPKIDNLRPIVRQACGEAERLDHEVLNPGHLLLTLIETPAGAVAKLLASAKGDITEARRYILDELETQMPIDSRGQADDEELDPEDELLNACKVLSFAIEEARNLHHADVGTGHVLLGMLTCAPVLTAQALTILGLPTDDLRQRILSCI